MLLENNIQQALAQQSIELEDAIDLRDIKNIKLANRLLKIRRIKKAERDQLIQQQNIQAQADANMQTQQQAAEMEVQKQQVLAQTESQLEQMKAQMDSQKLMQEAEIKSRLMEQEFQYNVQLRQMDLQTVTNKEKEKEDRKDERTRIQATQQSELIDQRKKEKPPKNFESTGNDILRGDFGLGEFEPRIN